MMYGSWDTECDWLTFLSFWTIFCPLTTWKIRILKNDFTYVYYIMILHMYTINDNYDVFLRYEVWRTWYFVNLDHFLPFYPLTTWKIKILKNWKKDLEISSFYTYEPKIIRWCTLPEKWCMTDGQMDGKKKWGGCPTWKSPLRFDAIPLSNAGNFFNSKIFYSDFFTTSSQKNYLIFML